jgi:hypothetical protein
MPRWCGSRWMRAGWSSPRSITRWACSRCDLSAVLS